MSSLPSADELRRALDRERVRAVRDARYRTNIDFAITKARTIVIGLAITASITMGWPLPAARALSPILTDVTAVHHQALCTTATKLGALRRDGFDIDDGRIAARHLVLHDEPEVNAPLHKLRADQRPRGPSRTPTPPPNKRSTIVSR